jgi:hypothetical protein
MVPRTLLSSLVAAVAAVALVAGPASAHGSRDWHHGKHHSGRYGATTLKLDPAAVEALAGLGVTPAPLDPAEALAADELAFPITNGFKSALRTGVIRHRGGISLTAGSTTVELRDFHIDVAGQVLTAEVGGARVPILDLDFSDARLSSRRGALTVGPVGGSLTEVAAGALDGAFGLPAGIVPPGLQLGDATVRYKRVW